MSAPAPNQTLVRISSATILMHLMIGESTFIHDELCLQIYGLLTS